MGFHSLSDLMREMLYRSFINNFEEWLESTDDSARQSFKDDFNKIHGTAITTSVMMSQTAADVHAAFGTLLRFSRLLPRKSELSTMDGVMERIVKRGNYHHVSLFLDHVRRGLDSGYSQFDSVLRGERAVEGIYKNETCDGALPSQDSQHAFTVAVAAVLHLLAFVLQYLIGYIDRGGTKTYSSGCFDFRASFVSVLLFLAAFVWIKFRQAARPSTGKRKQPEDPIDDANDPSHVYPRKYGSVTKYEARFTVPVNIRDEAHPVKHPRLTLGEHESPEVAAFVWRVAETCYEGQRGSCCVTLQGEPYTFPVPAMSERERGLVGEEKRQWVMKYAKDVGKKEYEKYAKQPAPATGTGSHDRSPSRRTCQPSEMLARRPRTYAPLNGLYAPSCSVPHQPPGVKEINAGSQHLQLEHQGPAQCFEYPGFSEEAEPQWAGESPPSDGRLKDYAVEIEAMLLASLPNSPPVLESTHDSDMPYLDSARLEDDSSPVVEAEAATVETVTYERLNESEAPSCSVPHQPRSVETVGEELSPGSHNVPFESTGGEQSESEQQTIVQQQQQPQVYGEEFVDGNHHQVSESQNPGLQQVHTPSHHTSDPLVARQAGKQASNRGSQHFQLGHQGPAQGFEGPESSEGVDVQWPEVSLPPDGMRTGCSYEELMALCALDFTFEPGIPLNSTVLFSDSAPLEDDNSPIFEAEAATDEHPQRSVQTLQQGRAACDAVEEYADRSGSDRYVVGQSQLVPQVFPVQSQEVDHLQRSASQLAEPSQQMSNGWGEPSESFPQRYERLLKNYEGLRKEKELSDGKKEICEQENERLRKEKELCEQENGRLRREKELSDEKKEICEQENERLRKEKERCEQENERLRREKELSDEKKELCEQENERLRKENKRFSDAIVVLVAPKVSDYLPTVEASGSS